MRRSIIVITVMALPVTFVALGDGTQQRQSLYTSSFDFRTR